MNKSKYFKYRRRIIPVLLECYPEGITLGSVVIRCGCVAAVGRKDLKLYAAISHYLHYLKRKGYVHYNHGLYRAVSNYMEKEHETA